jgi:RNA polymerase sigma factor (sigma-70 family)
MVEARQAQLVVYIVDDDASIRDSLSLLLGLAGYSTLLFSDAESFLAALAPRAAGCVVADLRLPGMSGLDLQAKVRERGNRIPFVIITAHGDVPAARAAFLAEAVDFIEKPFEATQLKAAIESAFEQERSLSKESATRHVRAQLLGRLTEREREVLEKAAQGLHAKEIGVALGISPRTVEVHKMRIMEKLNVRNIAELVRFALER